MTFIKKVPFEKVQGITYGELLDRYARLEQVRNLPGDKLCFARRKNLMHLRSFEKSNSSAVRIPASLDFEAYQRESNELRSRFLLTDKEGKSVMQQVLTTNGYDNSPLVDIANPQFIAKMDGLKDKYKAAIIEREHDVKAYHEFMETEVPSEEIPAVHEVKLHDVSGLSQEQVDAVYWFISEAE